jgi:hypothetical protein
MQALQNLLTTDYGLLSLFVIVFVIGMGGWLYAFAKRKMAEDAANAER